MTNCPVCQRESSPIKIGDQAYCNICGSPLGLEKPAPRRLAMDMGPRPANQAASATPAPVTMTAPAPTPTTHHGTAASDLHRRAKPSQVLDLRHAEPKPLPPQAPAVRLASPAHSVPAAPPHSTVHERHLANLDNRLAKARQIERSAHIQKFGGAINTPHAAAAPVLAPPAPEPHEAPKPETVTVQATVATDLPPHVITQHEAMAKLIQRPAETIGSAPTPAAKADRTKAKRPRLAAGHGRAYATAAAVVLMGGYIWTSNYPKFALQNANNQAGLTASLPGYLPSSYSLKSTSTAPGLVTLNFTSPSTPDTLQIAQHKTSWDSRSLLDNFVAKAADDYSTVQSQGLTIYLFNNNQASWVNHGIWYSIAGAGRLSREQILKIAYSL